MIKDNVQKALNDQLNAELYSSYLYFSMSAYFESINLPGFANWMRIQAQEEMSHVMKFYDYLNERGGRVLMAAVAAPRTEWNSPVEVFEDTYAHEQKVTGLINDLADLAMEARDHATIAFLQWFVSEQVEEEASVDGVLQRLKLAGDRGGGMFMLDQELGSRVFTPPAGEQGL